MIKIYYLTNVLALALEGELRDAEQWHIVPSAEATTVLERTNLALFFAKSKRIAIIFDHQEQLDTYFQQVLGGFRVVEAGGGVVSNPKGETLMIFRNGRWDLPKGKHEPGESIQECALREVSEECGITGLELGRFVHHTYHIYQLDGQMVIKRTWWYAMSHSGIGEMQPQLIEGITRVKWIGAKELVCYMAETYLTIQDVLMARFNLMNQ